MHTRINKWQRFQNKADSLHQGCPTLGPHLPREAVLCGPQGLFTWLISSRKGLYLALSGK